MKRKEQAQAKHNTSQTKGVGFVDGTSTDNNGECVDDCFKPFLFEGFVSLNESPPD